MRSPSPFSAPGHDPFLRRPLRDAQLYIRDLTATTTRQRHPRHRAQRRVPYWNRHFAAGQPIAANPEHEVFYPLTWLIFLPSYDFGYRLHILVHVYIGLFGMYALLRSMAVRAPAAFFGALSFGLGGLYLSYINLLPILFCAAWLPLTCLFVRRFLLVPRLRDFALAALFLGMQFLVGEPTTVMQTGFLIGMYALYRGWYAARDHDLPWKYAIPEMLSRVAFIGLLSISAFAVGAAQMISAIDHVGDSARSRPFDFSLVSAWSMPWAKFPSDLSELPRPHVHHRITWYGGRHLSGMGSPFIFASTRDCWSPRSRGRVFRTAAGGPSCDRQRVLNPHRPRDTHRSELLYEAGIATPSATRRSS